MEDNNDSIIKDSPKIGVYNTESGSVELIPEDSFEQAVLSGKYHVNKEYDIPVISPEGIPTSKKPYEIAEAFRSGYRYEKSSELSKRITLEKAKEQKLLTAAEGFARGVSLGTSDKALTALGVDPEEIQARKENELIAASSEVAGAILPMFITGGTSVAGKAAATALKYSPTKAAFAVGKTVENKLAKSVLKKIAADPKHGALVKKIAENIPRTAGSAVEGSAFGLGQLISEEALGNAEFNAESLFAYAGMGAALGGGTSAAFGGIAALTPKISAAGKEVAGRLGNVYANKGRAVSEYFGLRGTLATAVQKSKPLQEKLINFAKRNDKSWLPNAGKLSEQVGKVKEVSGQKLEKIYKSLDLGVNTRNLYSKVLNRQNFFRPMITQLNEEISSRAGLKSESEMVRVLQDFRDDLVKLKNKKEKLTFGEMWAERKKIDDRIKYKHLREQFSSIDKIRLNLRDMAKNQIDSAVEEVGKQIPEYGSFRETLKLANEDYHIASLIENSVTAKSTRENIVGMRDIISGGVGYMAGGTAGLAVATAKKALESDIRRKLVIFDFVEKGQKLFDKTLGRALNKFFSGVRTSALPAASRALIKSGLAVDPETGKKPRSREQAYKNVATTLRKFSSEPDYLQSRVTDASTRVAQAAPNTAKAAEATMLRAVAFLNSKLPRKTAAAGVLDILSNKIPTPSTVELAKFENYVSVIDNPMTVLEDLESGTLTRESVEALRAVYPEIYSRIQQKTMSQIAEDPDKLTYGAKVQLGILLDIPADASLLPQNVLALQQNFTEAQVEEPSRSVKPTQGGLKNIKAAGRAQTDTQRIQSETV